MQTPIVFVLDGLTDGGESGVTIRKNPQQDKLPPEFRYDVAPSPIGRVAPVYPYALLRDDTTGSATVRFIGSESGKVILAAVLKTTNLEFGAALLAAVERFEVNTRPSLGHPEASLGASWPSDRYADRARGIAGRNVASHGEWTRLRFKPALKDGRPTRAMLTFGQKFMPLPKGWSKKRATLEVGELDSNCDVSTIRA